MLLSTLLLTLAAAATKPMPLFRPLLSPARALPLVMQYGGGGDVKPGDWTCVECGANVFARKRECFRCGALKPDGEGGGYVGTLPDRGGYGRGYDRGGYDRGPPPPRYEDRGGYDRGYDDRGPPPQQRYDERPRYDERGGY